MRLASCHLAERLPLGEHQFGMKQPGVTAHHFGSGKNASHLVRPPPVFLFSRAPDHDAHKRSCPALAAELPAVAAISAVNRLLSSNISLHVG